MKLDSQTGTTRVGLVSNEPIRQAGLASAFDGDSSVVILPGKIEALLADSSIRYLILDLSQDSAWIQALVVVRRNRPDVRSIVVGAELNDELILRSITSGARAYLDGSAGPLAVRQAVEAVIQGSIWAPRRILTILIDRLLSQPGAPAAAFSSLAFSPRERQVLELIMSGSSNREIATVLGIEERTVKAYVTSLFRKTGAENRVSLSVQATQDYLRAPRNPANLGIS
jgi:DNA-binding NarL/FixJ family response regulator